MPSTGGRACSPPRSSSFQLEGLAGPRRELPDRRFHELFEQRVRAHPDAVAAVHGDRQWTYRELNARANRLARALLARGLRREGVVAVVTERNLDWMAAVLAIFKAGGVYLPIEPHFPADRIATMLPRAECRLVLTEPGSTATLDQALDSAAGHPDALRRGGLRGGPRRRRSRRRRRARTSSPTSTSPPAPPASPRGRCASTRACSTTSTPRSTTSGSARGRWSPKPRPSASTSPCGNWSPRCSSAVGPLIIEQEVSSTSSGLSTRSSTAASPCSRSCRPTSMSSLSYLEEHPRELPDLRCVSVTGEALKMELAQRWFAVKPGIRLVNAYGLTETSRRHQPRGHGPGAGRRSGPARSARQQRARLRRRRAPLAGAARRPGRDRLLRSLRRPRVHQRSRAHPAGLHDRSAPRGPAALPQRRLWPLAAGRQAGVPRPRDSQVKIRGFRIEIGEIENALLRIPGVRHAAVVVAERATRASAWWPSTRPAPLEVDVLRDRLGRVAARVHGPVGLPLAGELPLTANGKIDKKALTALAAEPDRAGDDYHAPRTPTERRLAAAWAEVLGVPQDEIGRRDHFFDRGGTSLSAVKLAIALDRAVSLKEVTRHPVLADLAQLIGRVPSALRGAATAVGAGRGTGRRPGVLPLHAGATRRIPSDGRGAAGQRAGALRRRAARTRPGGTRESRSRRCRRWPSRSSPRSSRRDLTRVLLWGQSSGAAFAVATARRLQERGVHVERLFLAAQLLGDVLNTPPMVKLSAPITVIVAADDPHTAESPRRYRDWQLPAECVDLHELPDGGHSFLRTRAKRTDAA